MTSPCKSSILLTPTGSLVPTGARQGRGGEVHRARLLLARWIEVVELAIVRVGFFHHDKLAGREVADALCLQPLLSVEGRLTFGEDA